MPKSPFNTHIKGGAIPKVPAEQVRACPQKMQRGFGFVSFKGSTKSSPELVSLCQLWEFVPTQKEP